MKSREDVVCILDAGAQYGGLIDRNIRELGVRTELLPLETPANKLKDFAAIVISGGPNSVNDENSPDCDPNVFKLKKPILGICYGLQLITKHSGGKVGATKLREDGPQVTNFLPDSKLLKGLHNKPQTVLMSHGDSVIKLPNGFVVVGQHGQLISAIQNTAMHLYGTQFHPEVFQTVNGAQIFKNFLFEIVKLKPNYGIKNLKVEAIKYIKNYVGNRSVILFLSGGVDSTVLAALLSKALNKNKIHAFHIDTGFMRSGESKIVIEALKKQGLNVTLLDESKRFYNATTIVDGIKTLPLKQITDPQLKRKIMGDTFATICDELIKKYGLGAATVLAQGSLRPDLIESGSHLASNKADTIKTHHNDTGAVRKLRSSNRVVEPLQQLYKDQVRQLGRLLGLRAAIINRHPFPGPGLAIRIICNNRSNKLPDYNLVQSKLNKLLTKEGGGYKASLLPIKTVGVQGDGRSYKYLVGLSGRADWGKLVSLANRIPMQIHEVNRVCYMFVRKKLSKVYITYTLLTPESINILRQADRVVSQVLAKYGLLAKISQMPVVLLPISFDKAGQRSIALRPFMTPDFMTGIPAIPGKDIPTKAVTEMVKRVVGEVHGVSDVVYDLSSKPPGTTEWE